jgi:hypothetical protein
MSGVHVYIGGGNRGGLNMFCNAAKHILSDPLGGCDVHMYTLPHPQPLPRRRARLGRGGKGGFWGKNRVFRCTYVCKCMLYMCKTRVFALLRVLYSDCFCLVGVH